MPRDPHDHYEHQLLNELDGRSVRSQRSIARRLGIALGLTNLLLREAERKGFVHITREKPNRCAYALTPAGVAEKARRSRLLLHDSVRLYTATRDRIRVCLDEVSRSATRIVFCGTGELAEIAYLCLQDTPLSLVGVIGDGTATHFFGFPVRSIEDLQNGVLVGDSFDRLVITSLDDPETMQRRLQQSGVAPDRIHWI